MSGVIITAPKSLSQINRVFQGLVDAGENPRPLLEEISDELVDSSIARFDAGVDPEGNRWKDSQRVKNQGGKTLLKDGHLVGSIQPDTGDDYAGAGTDNDVYAAIHQFGGTAGRNQSAVIDKRAYLGFSDEDREMILQVGTDYLQNAVGQ